MTQGTSRLLPYVRKLETSRSRSSSARLAELVFYTRHEIWSWTCVSCLQMRTPLKPHVVRFDLQCVVLNPDQILTDRPVAFPLSPRMTARSDIRCGDRE